MLILVLLAAVEKGTAILVALGFAAFYGAVIYASYRFFVQNGKREFAAVASETSTADEDVSEKENSDE